MAKRTHHEFRRFTIQIDEIDTQLVSLLNQRAETSLEVERRKAATLEAIFREIISASIGLQKPMTLAYWGPRGRSRRY